MLLTPAPSETFVHFSCFHDGCNQKLFIQYYLNKINLNLIFEFLYELMYKDFQTVKLDLCQIYNNIMCYQISVITHEILSLATADYIIDYYLIYYKF